MATIPLRAYRVVPRKPWLRAEDGVLTFRVPGWFGAKRFFTPLSNVAVADLALLDDWEPDVVFAEPVVFPYVYTSAPAAPPNIALVFAEPLRLPPFRLLARQAAHEIAPKRPAREGWPAGRYVDGMLLRAVDPAAATAALVEAGATPVSDPKGWLVERRALVTDPALAADIERREARLARIENVMLAVGSAGVVTMVAGGAWFGDAVMTAGGVLAFGTVVAQAVFRRLEERRAFSPPDAGPRRPPGDDPGA